MDESTRHWFDKLESKQDSNGILLTKLSTKMDIYLSRSESHDHKLEGQDERIDKIESYIEAQKAINDKLAENSKHRWIKITALIITFEVIGVFLGVKLF